MKIKILKTFIVLTTVLAAFPSLAASKIKTVTPKYPLPDKEGKIAEEQHLWLANKQSSSSHYSMTEAPKSYRNGMAGGFGSFGPLNRNDRQEEKYYIAMRWEYADWVEPESNLASALGRNDSFLVLQSGADFPKSGYVKVGSEYIRYSSKQGNKLKGLRRAYKGSAANHGKGENVKLVYKYKGGQWERMTRPVDIDNSKKDWYKDKKVLVTNEKNGKKVVAAILESGPAIWTGRVGGLSPEAFDVIDANINQKCTFQFVDNSTNLGKVN